MRVAGNFVDNDGLASVEYSVKKLNTPLIMVLGHTNCGAVTAAVDVVKNKAEMPGHLKELVSFIEPVVKTVITRRSSTVVEDSIIENVRTNVQLLKNSPPIVKDYVAQGKVKIVGGLYHLNTGEVTLI